MPVKWLQKLSPLLFTEKQVVVVEVVAVVVDVVAVVIVQISQDLSQRRASKQVGQKALPQMLAVGTGWPFPQ